ncbi:MAG: signal peptidase II [Candidatus Peregrinibacteria bacterium]
MRFLLLSLLFLGMDLVSKFHMETQNFAFLPENEFFRLELHHNPGISFSLPVPLALQIGISILVFIAAGIFIYKNPPQGKWETLSIALITGGALGNFIERVLSGQVTDFIAVWHFPVFNLADSFLFVGVVMLLINSSFQKKISPPVLS